jgi:hypothetical protein
MHTNAARTSAPRTERCRLRPGEPPGASRSSQGLASSTGAPPLLTAAAASGSRGRFEPPPLPRCSSIAAAVALRWPARLL